MGKIYVIVLHSNYRLKMKSGGLNPLFSYERLVLEGIVAKKKPNTVQTATELIMPVLEEYGIDLWDVRFEKEGSQWYLRYFIDRLEGEDALTIQDCEKVSRRIDKLLDETDPIEQSYILEVGSPGIERELTQDWHFEICMNFKVTVRLIRPVDGKRDFVGTLCNKTDKSITVLLDEGNEMVFNNDETAYIRLYADFDDGGNRG